ncbi:inovirus Gp2 family protein [Thalassotalea sp. SU-HH00458]|uniref:inovirus Gp2 family protein n=1 Tax=Thalassotalea sp. SU-HH00458 TaxID=3127657 RepID=UPI00310C0BCA
MKDNQYLPHLELHTSEYFNGYPVQVKYQPLIMNYLLINEQVLMKALSHHKRTCAMRFELKYPKGWDIQHYAISRFIDSLRVRIKSDLARKNKHTGRNDTCILSYIWTLERSSSLGWHYHVVIFVNRDIYFRVGNLLNTEGNMYSRIRAAWASALGLSFEKSSGLVHIPNNAVYKIKTNDDNYHQQVQDVLYRLSYFAKVDTKQFGDGVGNRCFGYSALN